MQARHGLKWLFLVALGVKKCRKKRRRANSDTRSRLPVEALLTPFTVISETASLALFVRVVSALLSHGTHYFIFLFSIRIRLLRHFGPLHISPSKATQVTNIENETDGGALSSPLILFQSVFNGRVRKIQIFCDRFERHLAVPNVQTFSEMGIAAKRFFPSKVRNFERMGQSHIVERIC